MNREELVNALRENAEWCDANEWEIPICMGDNQREAADMLENAETEKRALRNAANGFRDRAEMAERERDAAVADLEQMADGTFCRLCKHHITGDSTVCRDNTLCFGCNQFEWRGPQKDDAE